MKCPKCQNEINNNAKFCTKCGCNLAAAVANANQAEKQVQQPKQLTCVKCGAGLMPGAKFCTKCGTPAAPAQSQEADQKTLYLYRPEENKVDTTRTVNIDNSRTGAATPENQYGQIINTSNQGNLQQNPPTIMDIVPPDSKKKAKKKKEPKKSNTSATTNAKPEQEKAGVGLIIAAVILGVLVIASGVVCFMVWNGTISLPFMNGDTALVTEESTEAETETETSTEEVVPEINADELFAEEDAMVTTGKSQISVDAEIVNGMNNLSTAINQFVTKSEEAGDTSIAADRITDAYISYVTAVTRHKDMLNNSTLSGAIYAQIMMELNDAIALGDELVAKGYSVDTSALTSSRDEFDSTYTSKIISTFDEFTTRATWSRTESWNLMSETADNMFDPSDLDNPLRLRYAYALSWWTQKQIETEINGGTITAKGAAIKIANLIQVMDYNPMMLNYYITYMQESGEDCTDVENAYNEIVEHIAQTQGIRIGEDVALDHFWYFNDFGTYSVDSVNGVTPENRQWIRDRMSSVIFVTQ